MNTFKIQLLDENCFPERAYSTDACYDLKARCFINTDQISKTLSGEELNEIDFLPNSIILVPVGFKIALEKYWEALIRPRSGLSLKSGITVLNSPGTIDSDYRGEVGVILHNSSKCSIKLVKGMRIAQMAIRKFEDVDIVASYESLDETDRDSGGFGSSGI